MRSSPRTPRGLTTIEVLVALTLLSGGVLATLSVHATVSAMTTRVHRRRQLAVHLTSTLDSLRASPCAAIAAGASTTPAGRIAWRVAKVPGAATVTATATPTGGHTYRAETVLPCP